MAASVWKSAHQLLSQLSFSDHCTPHSLHHLGKGKYWLFFFPTSLLQLWNDSTATHVRVVLNASTHASIIPCCVVDPLQLQPGRHADVSQTDPSTCQWNWTQALLNDLDSLVSSAQKHAKQTRRPKPVIDVTTGPTSHLWMWPQNPTTD